MSTDTLLLFLLFLVLAVAINGLFVAFEFALVSMRRSRVQELIDNGIGSARTVSRLQQDMDETISGAQVGITLASLVLGWIGEPAIHELLSRAALLVPAEIDLSYIPPSFFSGLALALSFIFLSLLHVVLGEQVPKGIALRFPERLLLLFARPFLLYRQITFPLIWIFTRLAKFVLRAIGVTKTANHEPVHSADELSMIIDGSLEAGELDHTVTEVLQKALDLQDATVGELMIPLDKVDMVEQNTSFKAVLELANDSKHSRLPIYAGERTKIVGLLSTKDLFEVIERKINSLPLEAKLGSLAHDFTLAEHQRSILRVTAGVRASSLLHWFLIRRMPMALVMDDPETKVSVGIITLEDLLERLVGEINDEYDN
ncbi:MAG: HlyC/CorC family transporter [Cyanobacteriota bacterium erpe_2018_sw_21hr_WHONDRS-SW48-000092_B_bin.40]|jgi:CBS domain containing-hemolysin-like protein|nr:HlyC/CorC family transporter [Cyanobacteriota bacterium erpe_2018_sw_21hr_WHONDRS-SW48-000092_B_bin.40]